jgi:hypothetical protein
MIMISFICRMQLSIKAIVHGKGNLEDFEIVSRNVVKHRFLLIFDCFLEGTDFLVIHNVNCEGVTGLLGSLPRTMQLSSSVRDTH